MTTLRAMKNILMHWRWLIPLLLFSSDALAWGLYTHVYFAQLLLWSVPLTDPRFRRAVINCPRLVLAGACLPDLSLVGRYHAAPALDGTHYWEQAQRQLRLAQTDAERALALGYASHLLVDVIAHNHFVPAHEKMWGEVPWVTHAIAEWAMDRHIQHQLFATPAELCDAHRHQMAAFIEQHFDCTRLNAWRSLRTLSRADALLRGSRLHSLCYRGARVADDRLRQRFNHYLRETGGRLVQINRILQGEVPQWYAEPPCEATARQRVGLCAPQQLRGRMPLPQDLFEIGHG